MGFIDDLMTVLVITRLGRDDRHRGSFGLVARTFSRPITRLSIAVARRRDFAGDLAIGNRSRVGNGDGITVGLPDDIEGDVISIYFAVGNRRVRWFTIATGVWKAAPVNCAPSVFKDRTDSRAAPPLRPGVVQIQLPSASAAWAAVPSVERHWSDSEIMSTVGFFMELYL